MPGTPHLRQDTSPVPGTPHLSPGHLVAPACTELGPVSGPMRPLPCAPCYRALFCKVGFSGGSWDPSKEETGGWVERPQRGLCLGACPARPCPPQWCGPQHKYESVLGNLLSSWALSAGSESIDQASGVPALLGIQGKCLMELAGELKNPPNAPGLPGPQGYPRCAAHAGSCLCHPGLS